MRLPCRPAGRSIEPAARYLSVQLLVRNALPSDRSFSRRTRDGRHRRAIGAFHLLYGVNRRGRVEDHRCRPLVGEYFRRIFLGRFDGRGGGFAVRSNIVWAGTGSSKIRSNVSIGRGIYKSTDAGKTWTFAGPARRRTDRDHSRSSHKSRYRLRCRARQSVRRQQRSRRLSHQRRRQDVDDSAAHLRHRGRRGLGVAARTSGSSIRLHVARAAQALDHRQRRPRRRHLQEHGWRRQLVQTRRRFAERNLRPFQRGHFQRQHPTGSTLLSKPSPDRGCTARKMPARHGVSSTVPAT